jgi:hypothetical protein
MNLPHAAAFALVGWYLLVPPALDLRNPSTQTPGLFVDPSAPLLKWDTLATYESKAECERGHRERFSRVKATEQSDSAEADSIAKEGAELNQQKPLDSEKANALLVRSIAAMVKIQSNQKVILSECIATDDPRLKEK